MDASAETLIAADPVLQFSIFMENRVGRLNELILLLQRNEVHVMALMILDATDSSVVRVVVDDVAKMRSLLAEHRFPSQEIEVLAVELSGEAELKGMLAGLLEAEVNIHYVYSFIKRPEGKAAFVLKVEDSEVAAQSLGHRGFKVLTQHDIAR